MLKVPTYGSWLVMSAQGYDTPEKLISSENQKAFCVKFREFVRPGLFKFHEFLTKRGKQRKGMLSDYDGFEDWC